MNGIVFIESDEFDFLKSVPAALNNLGEVGQRFFVKYFFDILYSLLVFSVIESLYTTLIKWKSYIS